MAHSAGHSKNILRQKSAKGPVDKDCAEGGSQENCVCICVSRSQRAFHSPLKPMFTIYVILWFVFRITVNVSDRLLYTVEGFFVHGVSRGSFNNQASVLYPKSEFD